MPSIYAHFKFGNEVKKLLKKDESTSKEYAVIEKYPKEFEIGLQGPDILFFYKEEKSDSFKRKGYTLHRKDAYIFFEDSLETVRKYGKNSGQFAYILGYILHFVLDSECHPLIGKAEKQSGCSHARIEADLDYTCLAADGRVPYKFDLSKLVPVEKSVAESILPFCDSDMNTKKIMKMLKNMRRIKRIYYMPHFLKRFIIVRFQNARGKKNRIYQQAVSKFRDEKCAHFTDELMKVTEASVVKGKQLIENYSAAVERGVLSDEFHKDYLGKRQ